MQLNPNKITEKAGEIYKKLGEAYEFKDGLRSNQVRAAIIAICEEINKQSKENVFTSYIASYNDISNINNSD